MKILLTLDLNQPCSEERTVAESLLSWLWDQLQVVGCCVEILNEPSQNRGLFECLKTPSSLKKYQKLAPSPLTSYDLIIGVDLPSGAEALFTSLGIKTVIVRAPMCPGFSRFVLMRANFQLPEEQPLSLPFFKQALLKEFLPVNDASPPHRNWWLGNQYLFKHKRKDPLTLCIGTSLFQSERMRSGSLINLSTYADTLIPLLRTSPNFYYAPRIPSDPSEVRFMKSLGAGPTSLSLTELLVRDEFDFFISLDASLVPIAEAFHKKITLLGTHPTWTLRKLHQFCDRHFLEQLITHE